MKNEEFIARLSRDCGLAPGSHVLVALSGGADSVALLCLFLKAAQTYPLTVSCAHVEHGIRGKASLDDLSFVRALCDEKKVPLYTANVDAPAYSREHGCGMEDAARTLRYGFLNKTADAIGADVIALAHHAGDQAETVLLHAMRGSDVRGLCAMQYRSGRLIRPLLGEAPQQLRQYLRDLGQNWREDESNADTAYLRNRVRHDILPAMEAAVPGAGAALTRLARAAQRDDDYFAAQIDALNLGVVDLVNGAAVRRRSLLSLHPALLSRALVRIIAHAGITSQRADVIEAIMDAVESGDAVVNLTGGAQAAVGVMYLSVTRTDVLDTDTPLCVPGITDTPFGCFEVLPAPEGEKGDGKYAQRIPERLLLGAYVSPRRKGDSMIPFGRKTPEKLKKLMIDQKIERPMRASVPVVRDRLGNILWAVGMRPSQQCCAQENEKQMIVRFCGAWPCADMEK